MEGSQTREDRALAEASNVLGYKLSTNNTQYIGLISTDRYKNLTRVGRDNILLLFVSNSLMELDLCGSVSHRWVSESWSLEGPVCLACYIFV